jgi:hypothetical protein
MAMIDSEERPWLWQSEKAARLLTGPYEDRIWIGHLKISLCISFYGRAVHIYDSTGVLGLRNFTSFSWKLIDLAV